MLRFTLLLLPLQVKVVAVRNMFRNVLMNENNLSKTLKGNVYHRGYSFQPRLIVKFVDICLSYDTL
jgi:hypothetical protein